MMTPIDTFSIETLPNELLCHVFHHLDSASLSSSSAVSPQWYEIIADPSNRLWQKHLSPEKIQRQFSRQVKAELLNHYRLDPDLNRPKKELKQKIAKCVAAIFLSIAYFALYRPSFFNGEHSFSENIKTVVGASFFSAAMSVVLFVPSYELCFIKSSWQQESGHYQQELAKKLLSPEGHLLMPEYYQLKGEKDLASDSILSQNKCQLTKKTLFLPVIDKEGHRFEYREIKAHVQSAEFNGRCPLSAHSLQLEDLKVDFPLLDQIRRRCQAVAKKALDLMDLT